MNIDENTLEKLLGKKRDRKQDLKTCFHNLTPNGCQLWVVPHDAGEHAASSLTRRQGLLNLFSCCQMTVWKCYQNTSPTPTHGSGKNILWKLHFMNDDGRKYMGKILSKNTNDQLKMWNGLMKWNKRNAKVKGPNADSTNSMFSICHRAKNNPWNVIWSAGLAMLPRSSWSPKWTTAKLELQSTSLGTCDWQCPGCPSRSRRHSASVASTLATDRPGQPCCCTAWMRPKSLTSET